MKRQTSNILVINFWATWCRPCIKEMPVFQQIHEDYEDSEIKVLLVSLDFSEHLEDRVIPFVNHRKIESDVILLDDVDYNSWIDRVDVNWQGEIPFTWIIDRKNGEQYSHYGEITREKLNEIIGIIIKTNSILTN
jgi:thiol-disulfide isomerase/thioredoxin